MKEKVAVATVSGTAYFLLVNELKERGIDFLSIIPGQPLPAESESGRDNGEREAADKPRENLGL